MDNVIKLLLGLSVVLTVMIGGIVYVVLFAAPNIDAAATSGVAVAASPSADVITCDASSLEGTTCPDGHYCHYNTCVLFEAAKTCHEGETCRACDCDEGLVCHQNRCSDPTKIDRIPLVCAQNKRLADAVKQLTDKCAERKRDVAEIVSSGSCTAKDWEHLALEDDKFDLLLAAFPHRFAVHFQLGKPPSRSRDWPPSSIRDHYVKQIHGYQVPLRAAKQIFVIGRASPDGSPEANYEISLKRMNLVSEMIEDVLYEGMTETERSMNRVRIRSFTLPTAEPIQPDRYRSTYLNNPDGSDPLEFEPLMTWDADSFKALQKKLDDPAVVGVPGSRAWQELYGTINRVVLVIPIPCLGNEYVPPIVDIPKEVAG